jgi:hypothetical protein
VINCEQVIAQVQASLDEGSSGMLCHAALEHLARCADCAADAAELRRVHAALCAMPHAGEDMLPPGFHSRLLQRLEKEAAYDGSQWSVLHSRMFAGFVALAAVLLCVAGLQSWSGLGEISDKSRNAVSSQAPVRPTPDQVAAAIALANVGSFVEDAELPTPERVYADAAPVLVDLSTSFCDAAAALARPLSAPSPLH